MDDFTIFYLNYGFKNQFYEKFSTKKYFWIHTSYNNKVKNLYKNSNLKITHTYTYIVERERERVCETISSMYHKKVI